MKYEPNQDTPPKVHCISTWTRRLKYKVWFIMQTNKFPNSSRKRKFVQDNVRDHLLQETHVPRYHDVAPCANFDCPSVIYEFEALNNDSQLNELCKRLWVMLKL